MYLVSYVSILVLLKYLERCLNTFRILTVLYLFKYFLSILRTAVHNPYKSVRANISLKLCNLGDIISYLSG